MPAGGFADKHDFGILRTLTGHDGGAGPGYFTLLAEGYLLVKLSKR
jgi:hypothetical protein